MPITHGLLVPHSQWYELAKSMAEEGKTLTEFSEAVGRSRGRCSFWIRECAPELVAKFHDNYLERIRADRKRAYQVAVFQKYGVKMFDRDGIAARKYFGLAKGTLGSWINRNRALVDEERKKLDAMDNTTRPNALGLLASFGVGS